MKKSQRIYLDNNAGTFLDPRVSASLSQFLNKSLANPSSIHGFGREAKEIYEACRENIADFLGVKSRELLFTSSGSEAMNLLLKGVANRLKGGHIITSNVEHLAVRKTLKSLEAKGFSVTYLPVGLKGCVDPQAVKEAIQQKTCLITLMAANNETGVKTDIEEIAKIAKQSGIPFIVDAVAYFGKEPLAISEGISGMGFSGHKVHALQGVGAAFIRSGLKIDPLIEGGSQELGKRAGTENLSGVFSFSEAVNILKEQSKDELLKIERLRNKLEDELKKKLPGITINGLGPRICNTSNIAFHGVDGETLLIALDQEGVALSHGSACSSGALEPSPVLLNMGIPHDLVRSSLRISLSRMNQEVEIDRLIDLLLMIVPKLRK